MEEMLARNIKNRVTVTLTERELFLIKWSLELMRNNMKGGILKSDIESVRNKLSTKVFIPEIEKN